MINVIFVDDEPRVLQGLQRQLRDMRTEWSMQFVESGAKALAQMTKAPVDVIVSDMMMPGMDGAQLLTEVMKRWPQTVRLVLSGYADRESVLRLVGPAHQYLSKPCNADELRHAIRRASNLMKLLSDAELKRLAAEIRSLPSLPALHHRLTSEFQKDDPSIEKVGEIISQDLGMTTKLLQLVNSAFFGLAQPIANPADAVTYLGLTTIRALVLSVQVFSQFDPQSVQGFSIEALSAHCGMTGAFARRIAQVERCEAKVGDQCFLAGLLHDVGRLILAANLPDRFSRVIENAKESGRPLWQVEQEEFHASHAEVGGYLLGLWGLPYPVVEAVAYHHRPKDCGPLGFQPVIAVHAADAFANQRDQATAKLADGLLDLANTPFAARIETWRRSCLEESL